MTHYLIIGNGVAGTTAAENIRKLDKAGKITVVTEEAVPFLLQDETSRVYIRGPQ